MTFKLKKTELIKALITVLCALAVAFAVVLLLPRGAALADEPETEPVATYTVAWEYKADATAEQWQSFTNDTPSFFTYTDGVDYSTLVRAIIGEGENVYEVYNSGNALNASDMSLSFAKKNGEELETASALQNAGEYVITITGSGANGMADVDKEITLKIAPREFALNENDFIDYYGEDDHNRLWLLQDGDNVTELCDLVAYYDPDAEYNVEYGTNVTEGVLYNSYARYNGNEHALVLNDDYDIDGETFSSYAVAVKDIEYTLSNTQTGAAYTENTLVGEANKVNRITTTAKIILTDNWVLDNGERVITLTKNWYVVTLPNLLRTLDGDENTAVEGWAYGDTASVFSVRPEHGDNAVLTLSSVNHESSEVLARFAVQYSGKGEDVVVKYYDVKTVDGKYVIDTEKALDDDYCTAQLNLLKVGAYTLTVSVPAYVSVEGHEHWWDNAEPESAGIAFCEVSRAYSFSVGCYELKAENVSLGEADDKDVIVTLLNNHVEYNALDNNVPEVKVTFRGVELKYDEDYDLTSVNVKVGKASFTLVGKGSFSGSVPFDEAYYIDQATNSWKDVPSVMFWTYGNYDKQMNLISGTPTYLDNPNDISFKVTTDSEGDVPAAEALATFQLTDGIVSDEVAESLSSLPVGTYYLFASVKGSTNYRPLVQHGVAFKVFAATNSWEVTPAIVVWTEGQFKSVNLPVAKPLYGNAQIVIKDGNGKDVYNTATGVNKLSEAKAGMYTLTATVMGSNDYNGLVYSTAFSINEKPGIPVWATVLIVIGALLLVALVIFILIKVGVLRILTDKLMVKIRTEAAVDATVAAIRANKKNDEAKQIVAEVKQQEEAEAKKEERKKARRARAAEQKALPVEQKIAALEEKARKAEARAEKMRERAEAIQQRADRMREASTPEPQPTPEPTAEAAATETPETTTEE
ncbi:MAG: hypothetical protein K2I75_02900 [Clostridiales bacterium]|nr:hypothetical protein [Clostridiales bacterium]